MKEDLKRKVMLLVNIILVGLISSGLVSAQDATSSGKDKPFRICVPEVSYAQCTAMVAEGNPKMGRVLCIPATDKIACIEKIVKDEADFMPLEPEEIYVAHRFQPDGFFIVSEIREEPFLNRDFRYEPVVVVRKSSGIRSISDLKGKRSCHTGYGRNAGWKVPFAHLMDKGELVPFCEELDAPTPERDLNAVSEYFGGACAPGAWVQEKDIDSKLKKSYPKLCELCKNPEVCDRTDQYAGYDGALKCLTQNNGDVAWTKMDAVESFFKLKDPRPLELSRQYEFLCWDGSSQPLSTNPCGWARRPWKAIIASSRIGKDPAQVKALQDQIGLYREVARNSETIANIIPQWLKQVLEFKNPTDVEFNYEPHRAKTITPSVYLSQRNFTVTIEKPSCATTKNVRFCVRSELEKLKCTAMRMASMGQRIIPGFTCVLGESSRDCASKVARGEADVVVLSPKDADLAQKNLQLVPILSEVEETDVEQRNKSAPYRFAVAVIRSDMAGEFRGNISALRGKRSCHGSINNVAGWNAPLSMLRKVGEISGLTCGSTIQLAKYFNNQSCVPGALDLSLKMPWLPRSLCSLCAGDGSGPGKAETPETLCSDSDSERYYGDLGALRCLQEGVADVAFLDHVGLHFKTFDKNVPLNQMKLLCPNGTVAGLNSFASCNWGRVSAHRLFSRGGEENLVTREDTRLSLLKAQELFRISGKAESVFRMFGPYYANNDLLFQDTSIGLCDEPSEMEREAENRLIRDFDYCTTSNGNSNSFGVVVMILILTLGSAVLKF